MTFIKDITNSHQCHGPENRDAITNPRKIVVLLLYHLRTRDASPNNSTCALNTKDTVVPCSPVLQTLAPQLINMCKCAPNPTSEKLCTHASQALEQPALSAGLNCRDHSCCRSANDYAADLGSVTVLSASDTIPQSLEFFIEAEPYTRNIP